MKNFGPQPEKSGEKSEKPEKARRDADTVSEIPDSVKRYREEQEGGDIFSAEEVLEDGGEVRHHSGMQSLVERKVKEEELLREAATRIIKDALSNEKAYSKEEKEDVLSNPSQILSDSHTKAPESIIEIMDGNKFEAAFLVYRFKNQFEKFYNKLEHLIDSEGSIDGVVLPARSALHWGFMLNGFRKQLQEEFSKQIVDVPTSMPVWEKVKKEKDKEQISKELIKRTTKQIESVSEGKESDQEVQVAIFDESVNTGTTRNALNMLVEKANKELESVDVQRHKISSFNDMPEGSYPTWDYESKEVTPDVGDEGGVEVVRPDYKEGSFKHEMHRITMKLADEAGRLTAKEMLNDEKKKEKIKNVFISKDIEDEENESSESNDANS